MKIIQILDSDTWTYDYHNPDYKDGLSIYFDDKLVFRVHEGEPEDNSLGRNFNDCLNLKDLFLKVYEKGYNDGYNQRGIAT